MEALGDGDSKELAVRMAHDAAPELGDLCLVEPVLLVGAEVVETVREVDGHYRAVVAHQEERAAEALFLPGRGDNALAEEAGGVLDVLRLDLSERHAGVHDETSPCFGAGKTSWPCLADALKDKRRGPTRLASAREHPGRPRVADAIMARSVISGARTRR